MTAPDSKLVEAVARAISPGAFKSWQASFDSMKSEGKTDEQATEFADWCDDGKHPSASVRFARDTAQAAIAACQAEELLAALNRLTQAAGTMLNVHLADEENEIELCQDTDHHLAILELRGAFDAAVKVEVALLAKLDGKP